MFPEALCKRWALGKEGLERPDGVLQKVGITSAEMEKWWGRPLRPSLGQGHTEATAGTIVVVC